MKFELRVRIGFQKPVPTQHRYPVVNIPSWRIHSQCQISGSYHILSMQRHYEDYVVNASPSTHLPALPTPNWTFPQGPYTPLSFKLRASGVTANIGEAIGALVASEHLGCTTIGDVVHLSTMPGHARRKAPDYLLNLGSTLPPLLASHNPLNARAVTPTRWPLESKARNKNAEIGAVKQALLQLAAYWWEASSAAKGFGLVSNCLYKESTNGGLRLIDLHLFVPKPGGALTSDIQARRARGETYEDYMSAITPGVKSGSLDNLTRYLHGC